MASIKRCTAINTTTGAVTFVDVDVGSGTSGPPGPGVPVGGLANQILSKIDATNYNTQWVTPSAGSVADGSITNAKLATMTTLTVKGNATGATAAPTDLTASQVKTLLALTKSDVGLGNVDNTTDATKPVSTAQAAADGLRVLKAGDVMSGALTWPAGAGIVGDAAFGDISVSAATSGGSISLKTGGVTRLAVENARIITSLPFEVGADPVNPLQVVTKQYGDANYATKRQTISAQAGTTYTLVLTDEAKLLLFSASTAITLTVPLNATVPLPVGARIDIGQFGSGKVTVAGAAGTAVYCTPSATLRATGSMASLIKVVSPDTWFLTGDLA